MGCGSSSINTKNNSHFINVKLKKLDSATIKKNLLILENKEPLPKLYKIVNKIGKGCFGKVFKVHHYDTGQLRALKVVKKEIVKLQDDNKKFLKEIEVLSQLDHPNIIKIFEYFLAQDCYYVVMELAKGSDLMHSILLLSRYSESQAATIMYQLFSCIAYLHSKGIVHRDLKPENIVMESSNIGDLNIKLIDFGSAYILSDSYFEKKLNKEKKLKLRIGTSYFMAPEVIKGSYDNKCDLWSLGVILYILLSGDPPFIGNDDSDTFRLIKMGGHKYEDSQWENVSTQAKNLVDRLLTIDPKKRISAEEALMDPWIVNYTNINRKKECDLKIKNKINKFTKSQELELAIMSYLVHNYSSYEYCKELKMIFKGLDTSGDGRLSYDELRKGLNKHFTGYELLNDKEFLELAKSIDKDGSQYIEYEEFLVAFMNNELLLSEKNLNNAFSHFDKDKSGKLGMEEIKILLGMVTEEDNYRTKELIKEYDINGDGEISLEEFKKLMQRIIF